MVVPIDAAEGFSSGTARFMFESTAGLIDPGGGTRQFDVAPDGEGFVSIKVDRPDGESSSNRIIVTLNWGEELKRLVPKGK